MAHFDAKVAHYLKGYNDCLESIRASLREFPDGATRSRETCDVEVAKEVTRIAETCYYEGVDVERYRRLTRSAQHEGLFDKILKKAKET